MTHLNFNEIFYLFTDITGFGSTSVPIGIPPCQIPRGSVGSLSQSPTSPYGSFPHSILPLQTQKESHNEVKSDDKYLVWS